MISDVFTSNVGRKVYDAALRAIQDHSMNRMLKQGVVVGFSGGPDSVMLLLVLLELKKEKFDFPIVAVHVNHMIRGEEADRDERFSKEFCEKLGVEFRSVRVDVPAIATEKRKGIEEAAREVRYSAFKDIIDNTSCYFNVAVAHNATDNLETIVFNMMRGSGISGLSGISPVRDNIIRPLIYSSKADIVSALNEAKIPFVIDSTNNSAEYTRNYIRNKILPAFNRLASDPEAMGTRVSANLRDDKEFIDSLADEFLTENLRNNKIPLDKLVKSSKALFLRIVQKMVEHSSSIRPEKVHVDAIYDLLSKGNFSYSLPGNAKFVSENGLCYIGNDTKEEVDYKILLSKGVNAISGYSTVIILSNEKSFENYLNIYKISIHAQIPSAIMDSGLYVRPRKDGDSYFYGGMTRKLKKLFNDRKIPPSERIHIPVICDNDGIVWVPGFGVRTCDKSSENAYIALAEPISDNEKTDRSLYFKVKRY